MGGLTGLKKTVSKRAIAVLIEIRFSFMLISGSLRLIAHIPWPLSQSNPWNCIIQ